MKRIHLFAAWLAFALTLLQLPGVHDALAGGSIHPAKVTNFKHAGWEDVQLFGGVAYYGAENASKADSICEALAKDGFSGPVLELMGRSDPNVTSRNLYLSKARSQIDSCKNWVDGVRKRKGTLYLIDVNSNSPANRYLQQGDLESLLDYWISKYGTSNVKLLAVSESDGNLNHNTRTAFVNYCAKKWPAVQLVSMDSPHVGGNTEYHVGPNDNAPGHGAHVSCTSDDPDTLTIQRPSVFMVTHSDGAKGTQIKVDEALKIYGKWKSWGVTRVWYDFSKDFNAGFHQQLGAQ